MRKYLERIFTGSREDFCSLADKKLVDREKVFIVTANPEIIMKAENDPEIDRLLLSPNALLTPDGISIVKALNRLGIACHERITGVDLIEHLFKTAGDHGLSVFLLGAKEEIVSALAKKLRAKFPAMKLNYKNGYDGDKDEIMESIKDGGYDLVVVALGVPAQEKLIAKHYESFQHGVFVGVGGSFDVLSGMKKRAPKFFIKTNTEWLYRIVREPSRLGRFYESNVKFMRKLSKESRK